MALKDSTLRFSSRVENYIRYRPGDPPAMIDLLKTECGLTSSSVVADIGSGTGKLTELFLTQGNRAFGVEPNADLRRASRFWQAIPLSSASMEPRKPQPCRTTA